MGIVFRQSVKSSIIIAVGAVLGALINFIYPNIISKPEFGYSRTFINCGVIFHTFIMMGIGSTLINFSPRYETGSEKRKFLITLSAVIPAALIILLSIPYFLLKDRILLFFNDADRPLAAEYFGLVPVLVFLWSYVVALECFLISQSKTAIYTFIREVVLRVINIGLIGLLVLDVISFSGLIYGLTASYLLAIVILYFFSKKTDDFGFSTNSTVFSKAEYKEIFSYSWYHMFVLITMNLLGFVDTLLLTNLSPDGLSAVAIYATAVYIATITYMPYRAMNVASVPTLNRVYLSGDKKELDNIFHRSAINILIAAIAMFALIACNLDNAVTLLPDDYEAVKPLTLILMIGRMAEMATGLNTELTSVSKYFKFNFRSSALLLVMLIGLCFWLIPEYGMYGAAWGSTIALTIINIAKLIFVWVKLRVQPFNKQSLLVLICGGVAFLAGYFFPRLFSSFDNKLIGVICDVMLRSVIIAVLYVSLLIWLKPSADLSEYLKSIRANKRLF